MAVCACTSSARFAGFYFVRKEASPMSDWHLVWAYVDPVTVLPVTSLIATVVGVVVLGGRSIVESLARWARMAKPHCGGGTGAERRSF
jgi:hypothetical protein